MNHVEETYLTPGQVALMLHVSPKTISRWASEGRIKCKITLGGHRRFRPKDIEEIADRMTGTPQGRNAVRARLR
jgi:excisionase family DNA binding protein